MIRNDTNEYRVRRIIADWMDNETDPAAPPIGATLDSLGLDSLDAVELAMTLEEEFGRTINDENCTPDTTVGELIDLLV